MSKVTLDDECPPYEVAIGEAKVAAASNAGDAFEQILETIGSGGKWQWKLFFYLTGFGLFFSFNNIGAVFLSDTPKFWCIPPYFDNVTSEMDFILPNSSLDSSASKALPWQFQWKIDESCEYYNLRLNEIQEMIHNNASAPNGTSIEQCTKWYYDKSVYKSTIVTEWDLVCQNRWKKTLIQPSYMVGMMVGGILFSELSDLYGRRTVSLLCTVLILISNISVGFSYSYGSMLILRFITAMAGTGIFISNFVILIEIVGRKHRGKFGSLYQLSFGVGLCILPGIAFLFREWRKLSFALSVPGIVILFTSWIIPESPRWLLHKGRKEEAVKILKEAAKVNGGSLPTDKELHTLLSGFKKDSAVENSILQKMMYFFKSQAVLVKTPIMRRRSLLIFFSWFVAAVVYVGLVFNGGNINASIYLVVFLSGIVEIPSIFIAARTVQRYGRRINVVITFFMCGAACMLILAVPKELVWLNLTLSSIGKFFNNFAFTVVFIYTAELVPTEVRNIAMGTSGFCARIGGAVAPFIVDGLGSIHYAIPSTVFGILSLLAGAMAFLLPETGNDNLPESIEDVESKKK